ncbi:phosphoribosyltransferase [Marinobacter pelagius]|uniref:phosphoribosyltransferase n=1 Tax=Marinobacter sp. C7 TaxID=2951363 RepID=UPI001EF03A03|nr:phosphoribosyltransferase [Marinobacter sp. C7]MCG7201230.1 phosphoribosyltransferase [Marinobacter sp. C7]
MAEPTIMKVQLLSPDEVVDACDALAKRILASRFRPEMVVAVARGGFMPARFLCDFLDLGTLCSIRVQHYAAGASKGREARVTIPLAADIRGARVLVVDDVNDSGDTLRAARSYLEPLGPAELRTAVLHEKLVTTCPADFSAGEVRKWRWILYPWAMVEDIAQFVREMAPAPRNAEETLRRLQVCYGLELTSVQLTRVVYFGRLPDVLLPDT